jgi:uncharacterized protein YbjT (DUF2867 family)
MRVAVAGGTGAVGRHVVAQLRTMGHDPVPLSRSTGVDLVSGAGLDQALVGAEAVIDASGTTTARASAAVRFFDTATRALLEAEARAGVHHHVVLSIAGCDRVDFGYYQGKRAQESAAMSGAIPWSVLRAAQFHEFAAQVLDRTRGPVAVVPRMRVQPIAAREVAIALAQLAVGPAVGLAPELGGPQPEDLDAMARAILRARGSRRALLALRLPGSAGKAMAAGALRPQGAGPAGTQTFAQWLAGEDGTALATGR